jgi:hypothetical protein
MASPGGGLSLIGGNARGMMCDTGSACIVRAFEPPHPKPSPARGEGETASLLPHCVSLETQSLRVANTPRRVCAGEGQNEGARSRRSEPKQSARLGIISTLAAPRTIASAPLKRLMRGVSAAHNRKGVHPCERLRRRISGLRRSHRRVLRRRGRALLKRNRRRAPKRR